MDFSHDLPIYCDVVFAASVVGDEIPDVLGRGEALVLVVLGGVENFVEVVLDTLAGVVERET